MNSDKFYKSVLFAASSIFSLIVALLPIQWSLLLFILAVPTTVKFPHYLPKYLLYEIAIADLIVRAWLTKLIPSLRQEWWHEIAPGFVIGGIPLTNYDHLKSLQQKGVNAVYAILEDFEAYSRTFYSAPILENQWEAEGIDYFRLHCRDMQAISLQDLLKAVEWVRNKIARGKVVYVHCKAGRGRSAMVAAAYLMKYSAMSLRSAVSALLEKRSVVTFRPCQFARLEEFELEQRPILL
jgi:atypical dual specificity phosphatase